MRRPAKNNRVRAVVEARPGASSQPVPALFLSDFCPDVVQYFQRDNRYIPYSE